MSPRLAFRFAIQGIAAVVCTYGVFRYPDQSQFWILEFLAVLIFAYTVHTAIADRREVARSNG
jgi:hypothetical protein